MNRIALIALYLLWLIPPNSKPVEASPVEPPTVALGDWIPNDPTSQRLTDHSDRLDLRFYHYSPFSYPVGHQVWSIEELPDGRIAVAEKEGIKIVSSGSWQHLEIQSGSTVRSMKVVPESTGTGFQLYYGAQGEIGIVSADSLGRLSTTSLNYLLPDNLDFGDVWSTHFVDGRVIFQTSQFIFSYDGKRIESYESKFSFHNSFSTEDDFYVRERGTGLLQLRDGNLVLLSGGEIFQDEMVFAVLSGPDGNDVVWARFTGQYKIGSNGKVSRIRPYPEKPIQISNQSRLYGAERMVDGRVAIATLGSGLVLVDDVGNVIATLDENSGLPDTWINSVRLTSSGNLWLAFDSQGLGVLKEDYPTEVYGREQGLTGNIYKIGEVDGVLTLATSKGLYERDRSKSRLGSGAHIFAPTSGIGYFKTVGEYGLVWDFVDLDDVYITASESGVRMTSKAAGSWEKCNIHDSRQSIPASEYKAFTLH